MEKYYMAAMGGAEGFGNKSIEILVNFFGSAKAAWSAETAELFKTNVRKNSLGSFIEFRVKHPNAPEKIMNYCARHKIGLCSIFDEDYPPILKEINSPPMFFYYRGKIIPNAQRIGIVGSRRNTAYGQNVALELGEQLAAAGLTVVSGAARGIDTFAHRGALKSGRTVAVLGCGISFVSSRETQKLFESIAENGVVLSEFPPQLPPNKNTFPTRNRIIAGLCKGVVVVEADFKSGALITSDYAVDNNRDVFAIPGQIYANMSRGCNELIRKGAILIKNAQDVLDEYDISIGDKVPVKIESVQVESEPEPAKPIVLDEAESKVLEIIPADKFITSDEILMQLEDIEFDELNNILLKLDLKNCVEENAERYKRKTGG